MRKEIKSHPYGNRKQKKDAVLHLRIERIVMEKIKEKALQMGMSVSDMIRRHLSDHFLDIEEKSFHSAFLKLTYAWVDVVLARESKCAICKNNIDAYEKAWLAQGPPLPSPVVCSRCHSGLKGLDYKIAPAKKNGGVK